MNQIPEDVMLTIPESSFKVVPVRNTLSVETIVHDKDMYPDGLVPATEGSAGIDLRSSISCILAPNVMWIIDSQVSIWVRNPNFMALLLPRSSWGRKGLMLANTVGVVDADFQGHIQMMVVNTGRDDLEINYKDRIAQLLITPVLGLYSIPVEEFSQSTQRGAGGIGSTGK